MSLLPTLKAAVVEAARDHDRGQVPSRDPRRRWLLLAGTAGGLAVAGTVAALVVGAGSHGRLDVADEARAALAPRGGILHLALTTRSTMYDSHGKAMRNIGQAALASHVEQWSAKDPVRFRMLTHASPETIPGTDRPLQPRFEVTWANRTQTVYDGQRHSMNSVTKLSRRSSASELPAIPGVDESLDDLSDLLAAGKLHDEGLITVAGRELRRLSGPLARMSRPGTVDLDIDPDTFEPVRITTHRTIGPVMGGGSWTSTEVATVDRFEHLPLTTATARLLVIDPPKGTTIVSRTLGEARAYGRRLRAAEKRRAKAMKASGKYR